jgi:hypothetical protein
VGFIRKKKEENGRERKRKRERIKRRRKKGDSEIKIPKENANYKGGAVSFINSTTV